MIDALRRNRSQLITLGVIVVLVGLLAAQYEPKVGVSILLSGLTLGALYFLVTSGLSLIFGLMDVLNFAHALFFMFGAYIGYTLYANPRMLLNTLPFALALGGGVLLGGWAGGFVRAWTAARKLETAATAILWVITIALLLAGLWGFDLPTLAANAATSAGGAVPTDIAQEADSRFILRVALLVGAGLTLGIGLALRHTPGPRETGRQWRGVIGGLLLVGLAFALIALRAPGETAILAMSSDLRFVLALLFGAAGGALAGGLVEWGLIRPLYSRPIYQVLLTLGLVLVGTELVKGIWGPAGFYMDIPAAFNTRGKDCPAPNVLAWFSSHCASIDVLGRPFPSYRLFVIALGLVMFVAIALVLQRTRLGMIIRAGVQDSEMVQALGINVRWVFTLVFALGTGLAALGGVAAAPFIGVNPGLGQELLLVAFIAVVIGGMGSYSGAALGALLVGLARAFGDQLVLSGVFLPGMDQAMKFSPSIARASTVLLMAVVLLWRPAGLFGRKDHAD